MFATASPHETVPVRGASRGSERNGFRRKRIVRKRMVQERAEHAEAIPYAAERAGAGQRSILREGTRVLRRQATATQRRSRASGSGVRETGREAIPSMLPATPGPANINVET
jgi:hypothetical protein